MYIDIHEDSRSTAHVETIYPVVPYSEQLISWYFLSENELVLNLTSQILLYDLLSRTVVLTQAITNQSLLGVLSASTLLVYRHPVHNVHLAPGGGMASVPDRTTAKLEIWQFNGLS